MTRTAPNYKAARELVQRASRSGILEPKTIIAAEARMFTPEEVAIDLKFTHKHRVKTVLRLKSKGLVITDLGHRTKRISELDLIKFKTEQRALEKTARNQPRKKNTWKQHQ